MSPIERGFNQYLGKSLKTPSSPGSDRSPCLAREILECVLTDTFGCGKLQESFNPPWYPARPLPAEMWTRLLLAAVQLDDFPAFLCIWYISKPFSEPPAALLKIFSIIENSLDYPRCE